MEVKEKAEQLISKFIKHSRTEDNLKPMESAKQRALIHVNGIIEAINELQYSRKTDFWQEVKQEIANK